MPLTRIVKPLLTEPFEIGVTAVKQTAKLVGRLPTDMAKTGLESLTAKPLKAPPEDNDEQEGERDKAVKADRTERVRKFRAKQRQVRLLRQGILAEQKRKEQKRSAEERQQKQKTLLVEQKKKEVPLSVQIAQKGREIFRGASG